VRITRGQFEYATYLSVCSIGEEHYWAMTGLKSVGNWMLQFLLQFACLLAPAETRKAGLGSLGYPAGMVASTIQRIAGTL
jgi:hypothetical protein